MAKNTVADWSTNADLNTDVAGVDISENCPAAGINNAMRAIMAQVATWLTAPVYAATALIKDGLGFSQPVGYRNIPARVTTADDTIALTDAGRKIRTGFNLALPANATMAFPIDDGVLIVNTGASSITVTPAAGVTLYLSGNTTAGARTIAAKGRGFLSKEATDEWHLSGPGVS